MATNDSHYLCEDDAHAQDVMLCIQTGKSIQDTNRMKFQGTGFFVKSHDEMHRVFKDAPDVLSRTLAIAERCNMRLEKSQQSVSALRRARRISRSTAISSTSLAKDSRAGWRRCDRSEAQGRLKHSLAEYEQRLARELAIIQQMKFSGYFLIVWDFIRYAREHDIPVGPGRGSAAGSLVSYALGITDLDPLQHELIFERFLNPERISLPDIDIDFCMNRRGEVINYVTHKYGRENVAQIITFGTMAAKAAIKDVGRAMDVPYADVDRIAKMVPTTLNIKLEEAIRESAGAAAGLRQRSAGARAAGHRQETGRHGAQRRSARRRRGDLSASAERTGSAVQDQERRNRHRLRHGGHRKAGPAEDGFPGPDHAHHSRRHGEADRADPRRAASFSTASRSTISETYEKVFHKRTHLRRVPV